MPWAVAGAVIGAAGSIYAADTQADAASQASDAAERQYQQTRADNAPWRQAGQTALTRIGDLMGTSGNVNADNYGFLNHQFNADDLKKGLAPNYDFQLQQGLGAATNAANAGGFGGNALKGINDYAQNYAAGAYQQAFSNYTANQTNIYNRLSNLAGLGQTANQIDANAGVNLTGQAINAATSGAASRAAGVVGAGNAINNGVNNYMGWNYLNSQQSAPDSGNRAWSGYGGTASDPWYG